MSGGSSGNAVENQTVTATLADADGFSGAVGSIMLRVLNAEAGPFS